MRFWKRRIERSFAAFLIHHDEHDDWLPPHTTPCVVDNARSAQNVVLVVYVVVNNHFGVSQNQILVVQQFFEVPLLNQFQLRHVMVINKETT